MAANAFARYMTRPLHRQAQFLQLRCPKRTIHSSTTLHKKRGNSAFNDDLFSEDDLLEVQDSSSSSVFSAKDSSSTEAHQQPQLPPPTTVVLEKTKGRKRPGLPLAVRNERFDSLLSFMVPRIGRKSTTTPLPLVKKQSWLTLLDLAANKDQMQKIVDLFPKYKDGKGEFPDTFADAFTQRCHQLSCPELALTVFGDFAKHNLTLTLTAGRWLLHSLYVQHPISQTFLAASYFPAYNLKIHEDLPSAAMLAAACYNHNHKTSETVKVAEVLLPRIRRMIMRKKEEGSLGTAKSLEEARFNKWAAWAVKRVNKAVFREKGEFLVPPDEVPSRIMIAGPSPAPHLNVAV